MRWAYVIQSSIMGLIVLFLSGCYSYQEIYAPVLDGTHIEPLPPRGIYRVEKHQTLYSIAWRYGLDYRVLAERNHISPPYSVKVGQILYLTKNASRNAVHSSLIHKPENAYATRQFSSPVKVV